MDLHSYVPQYLCFSPGDNWLLFKKTPVFYTVTACTKTATMLGLPYLASCAIAADPTPITMASALATCYLINYGAQNATDAAVDAYSMWKNGRQSEAIPANLQQFTVGAVEAALGSALCYQQFLRDKS